MAKVKCKWCKESEEKETMYCLEKPTNQTLKSGKPKVIREYYHHSCFESYKKDKEVKQKELEELDKLYKYLLDLHNLTLLDSRMMEKIQDLRNGTVKYNNKKIKKYKEGVNYIIILKTYMVVRDKIDLALRTKQLDSKWNEFTYAFAIMSNSVNDVLIAEERKIKSESINNLSNIKEMVEIPVEVNYNRKRDEMDISNLL